MPAIACTEGIELIAVASRNAQADGCANYPTIEAMLVGEPGLDAIVLCQPPQARYVAARTALLAGKHVFLEKPPGATLSEVDALVALAQAQGVTLYASWHSRYAAAVAPAKQWLQSRTVVNISIVWKEDVRHWHPRQDWIWEPGGFGVFDPGINALSILTEILPQRLRLVSAELEIPANRAAPIAAKLALETADGVPISAVLDWRQIGPQTWDIIAETDQGSLLLSHGGNQLAVAGVQESVAAEAEYAGLYRHFVALIQAKKSDVDVAPLQIVADAFLIGHSCLTDHFDY